MILLIEGCNYTGKTTLANLFRQHLNDWPILKFNVPPENAYQHFHDHLVEWSNSYEHFIVDRGHFSNAAYHGRLGGGVLNFFEWWRLDDFFARHNTWLFLMVDDPYAIAERLQQGGARMDQAHALTRREIADIQEVFMTCFNTTGIETKGSFILPQFWIDGHPTAQFASICYKIRQQILK